MFIVPYNSGLDGKSMDVEKHLSRKPTRMMRIKSHQQEQDTSVTHSLLCASLGACRTPARDPCPPPLIPEPISGTESVDRTAITPVHGKS